MATKKLAHPKGCACKKCQPSLHKKHIVGCQCVRCRRVARWKARRRGHRHAPGIVGGRSGWLPRREEDENKVAAGIFDKVYGYFESGTHEAVVRECKKLVQTCETCRGTGIEKQQATGDATPCSRCTDARNALNVLDGLRKSAAEVRDKATYKDP